MPRLQLHPDVCDKSCYVSAFSAPETFTGLVIWKQQWSDVLFLHWPVDGEKLQKVLPKGVEVDRWQGQAWVSVVVFRLKVRHRWLPFMPGCAEMLEVNLRTYVRCGASTGIWFLSVYADNPWAMWWARKLTPMPYQRAKLSYQRERGEVQGVLQSWPHGEPRLEFCLAEPNQPTPANEPLDAWLVERYRLFIEQRGQLMQADVAHPVWEMGEVTPQVRLNRLGEPFELDLADRPAKCHYSVGLQADFGRFVPSFPAVD